MPDDLAERVDQLERGLDNTRLVCFVTAIVVILLVLVLRRKGLVTSGLWREAFGDG